MVQPTVASERWGSRPLCTDRPVASLTGALEEAQIHGLCDITGKNMLEGRPGRCSSLLIELDELIIPNENELCHSIDISLPVKM